MEVAEEGERRQPGGTKVEEWRWTFEPGGSKEAKSENLVSSIQNLLPAKLDSLFCLACDDHNIYDMLIILYNRSVTVSPSQKPLLSVCDYDDTDAL